MTRILLYSQNDIDIAFYEGVSKFIKIPLMQVKTPEEICDQLQSDPEAIIVVDVSDESTYKAFEACLAERIGLFNAMINPNTMFFVADKELYALPYLAQSEIFGTYMPRRFKQDNEATIGRLMLSSIEASVVNRSMSIDRFFSANAKIQKIKIDRSTLKQAIVESLKNHLIEIGFKMRSAALIASAADEIIMNAIFDAPIDETGKYIHLQTPRSKDIMLDPKNTVEFSVAFDGRTLGISVNDQYGSLDKKKLLRHISKSYESDEFKVKTTVAGAGIGLANVYRNCAGIIFECEQGLRTQVTILYRKTDSFKDFKDQFRFVSTLVQYSS